MAPQASLAESAPVAAPPRDGVGEAARPGLPASRGPLSEEVLGRVTGAEAPADGRASAAFRDSLAEMAADRDRVLGGDDFHLALYLLYELSYGTLPDAAPELEWDPHMLECRRALEDPFMDAVQAEVGSLPAAEPARVGEILFEVEAADEGPSLSRRMETRATLDEFREMVVHRSAYQLREADPHSWVIPRLRGAPKAALLEVQFDEYGAGNPERMHSLLFAKAMREFGLDDRENAYLDWIPGTTLATVNLMSALGMSARWKGATVGHLAMFEMSSAGANRRYSNGLRRLGMSEATLDFYEEHVAADSVHENIAAYDMAGGVAREEPHLADQVVFGGASLIAIEQRFARAVLERWDAGETSLRMPFPHPAETPGRQG